MPTLNFAREDTELSGGDVDDACHDVDELIAASPTFSFENNHHHQQHHSDRNNNGRRKKRRRRRSSIEKQDQGPNSAERRICTIWMTTLALMIPFTLIISSGEREYWAMSPGQTRAVLFPAIMTESIHVRRTSFSSPGAGGFSIHQFDGSCPPLTGPIDTKTGVENIELQPGQYEYRSMYLNEGSKVNINLTALEGGAEMFLFKGELAFEAWRDHPEYRYMSTTSVRRGGSKAPKKNVVAKPLHIEHDIIHEDIFYLIYYNPKRKKTASITAAVTVQMTTHDLTGQNKQSQAKVTCSHDDASGCSVETSLWKMQCTIIGANTTSFGFDDDLDKYPILSLEIARYRRWSMIYIISLIPFLLALLYADGTITCGETNDTKDHSNKDMYWSDESPSRSIQVVVHATEPTETTPLNPPSPEYTRHVSWASPVVVDESPPQYTSRDSPPADEICKHVRWASPVVFNGPPSHICISTPSA